MSSKIKSGNVSFDLKRFAGIKRDYTKKMLKNLKELLILNIQCVNHNQKTWNLLNMSHILTLRISLWKSSSSTCKSWFKAIYLSGWQVAADANSAGEMYPDQSLYPYDSAPKLVEAMNNALIRADQIQHMEKLEGKLILKIK